MLRHIVWLLLIISGNSFAIHQCGGSGVALQVLGSGGPIADDGRASASYLIWQAERASVMVDIGGGSILRFAESGADLETLDAVAITHTHVDHIGDFPALMKHGYFSRRQNPLPLFGPDGNHLYPSISEYMHSTFLADNASHRYLAGIGEGNRGLFKVAINEVLQKADAQHWRLKPDLSIATVGVHHAIVPAIGYVINLGGYRIAIPGDMSLNNPRFIALAKSSDILVLHLAIPESSPTGLTLLHAKPSEMGQLAAMIQPKQLILSHIMQRAEQQLDLHLDAIQDEYSGPIKVATDLACYPLSSPADK